MSLFQPLWQPAATTAATIPNTPAGSITATTVQGAINELDAEKLAIAALAPDNYAKYLVALNFGAEL